MVLVRSVYRTYSLAVAIFVLLLYPSFHRSRPPDKDGGHALEHWDISTW